MSELLLRLAFRLHARWLDLEVVHRGGEVPVPSILYFNYAAPYAPLVGRALTLPRASRARMRATSPAAHCSISSRVADPHGAGR